MGVRRGGRKEVDQLLFTDSLWLASALCSLCSPECFPAEFLPPPSMSWAGLMTFQQEHLDQAHIETLTFCKFIRKANFNPELFFPSAIFGFL